jgi:hypothetical protein
MSAIGTKLTWLRCVRCPLLSEKQTSTTSDLRLSASGAKRPVTGMSAPGGRTEKPQRWAEVAL